MTLNLQQQAQRRMRRALIFLVGLVLVLVGALVTIAITGGESTTAAPDPKPSPAGPSAMPTVRPDDGGYVAPNETVKLPDGAAKAGVLPVQFPHTPEGAAAMAVASVRNAWSLDAAQIKAGILAYSSAQYRDQMAAVAEDGAKGNRQYAGIPDTGPVPAGATLNAWPIGVKYAAVNSDTVDVLVLLRVTHAAKAGAEQTTTIVVSPGRAVWEGGDWKGVPTAPGQPLPDPVDIGTAFFNEDKWKAIQEGDRL
ncbi:hypothetical protein ADK91_02960 [Streptomyces sp. XY511]|uniref:hypothetical protein n=1 Tax=Streptomyces sp. XY511 TaxID=1519480 RepID=UPI0006ADD45A|nr:hypothetical protein [Streptomyces sp. XY511]KOV17172.1 hypothetical protein ADK91_02960 [Streptomyces sp. XY511]